MEAFDSAELPQPYPITREVDMADADADAGTDADADGETDSSRHFASPPAAAAAERRRLWLVSLIKDYGSLARAIQAALSQMDVVVREADALGQHTHAILSASVQDRAGPLTIPQLIDRYRLPSARELDEIERALRLRILYDIKLTSKHVRNNVDAAVSRAREELSACHQTSTYKRNHERLYPQEECLPGQQLPTVAATATTTTTTMTSTPESLPPQFGTSGNNSDADSSSSSSTTFPTPDALEAALRRDHTLCAQAIRYLKGRLYAAFCGNPGGDPGGGRRDDAKPPARRTAVDIVQGNLQWFDYAKRRSDRRVQRGRRERRNQGQNGQNGQNAHVDGGSSSGHDDNGDADDVRYDDDHDREEEEGRQREYHRRQVYVGFEDFMDAEVGDALDIYWPEENGHAICGRGARRRLITECWEWQAWLARDEMGRAVGLMQRLEEKVLGDELVWPKKAKEGKVSRKS